MATRTATNSVVRLTCPVCDVTVNQAPGTRRTICPHCGNFYDAAQPRVNGSRPQSGESDEKLPDVCKHEKEKSGGRFGALANFFHNLGPNKNRAKSGESPSSDSGSHRSAGTSRTVSQATLPPISQDSKGRLTVNNRSEPHSSGLSSPNGSPAKHETRPSLGKRGPDNASPARPSSRLNSANQNRLSNAQTATNRSVQSQNKSNTISYPLQTKALEQLQTDVKVARETENWKELQDFYATTFDSFLELNAAFKRDPSKEYKSIEDPGLRFDHINGVYDLLVDMPQEVQKVVLKAIINSLLKDKRLSDTSHIWPHTKDDLRAYLILLQNPQFNNIATYVIFAHLLRQVAGLQDQDHHFLVHWFKRIEKVRFQQLVTKLHNFISCRLFPPKPQDLPVMAKCTWWIPSATKVLALLNAANNLSQPVIILYLRFYNSTLDHLDLMAEYYTWQNPNSHPGFSFCQYPFILSITAKRSILQRDSEQQMIIMARRSLVAKVQRRQLPDIGMLFLNLMVRRSHLVSDSLNEIARKQHDLKKKLKVTFAGEPGLDMGGLTKEWFLLLIRQIFQQEYGMFTHNKQAKVFWFSTTPCENYQEFNLVGVLMGLAVYNSIILDIRFPPCCYKKLLSPAVVPYNNPRATVGVTHLTLRDLAQTLPDLAHGLQELLDYEGNVEDDFCLTFQASYTEYGQTKTHILKPDGENLPVTNDNKKEYVQLYVDHLLNKSIYRQFQAFYHGFHSVCASNALIMLRPEEVEMLVCGNPSLNMADLKKVTVLDGYQPNDITIKNFWEAVLALSLDLQKRLLLFATGSDRIPIGGMSEMQFKITRVDNTSMLPMSHTCFNQLVLPSYKSKKVLKTKLIIAIQNAEGFGIE